MRFLGNVLCTLGGLNPVGKLPRQGGNVGIFDISDYDEIWYAGPLGTQVVLFFRLYPLGEISPK